MRAWIVALVLLVGALPAHAQDEAEPQFDVLVARAVEHYDARRYEPAIELFEQAYALRPEPELVYNIARSYERLARSEDAIREYQRFVELPGTTSELRSLAFSSIEALQEEQRRRAALARANEPPPAAEPAGRPVEEPPPTPASPEPIRASEHSGGDDALALTGWTVFGVGAATVIAGAVLGGLAFDRNEQFEAADDYATKVSLQGEVRDLALITDVLLFTGGAVALSGLIMGIVGATGGGDDELSVSAIAAPGLAGVSVDARF